MPEVKYSCFVIAAFGETGTAKRKNFEDLIRYLIRPVFKYIHKPDFVVECGLDKATNDQIQNKVIDSISTADLCIADISEQNPNVYYEIGLCKALKKPVVFTKWKDGADTATDLGEPDYIEYDSYDASSLFDAQPKLQSHIEAELDAIEIARANTQNDTYTFVEAVIDSEAARLKKTILSSLNEFTDKQNQSRFPTIL